MTPLGETDPAQAASAYREALSVAGAQGSRAVALMAALSLAKLYQSSGRPIDAHAVLAPALEGFTPTPEMAEIAEAQVLLAALEEMDAFKADAARASRRKRSSACGSLASSSGRNFSATWRPSLRSSAA